MNSQAARFRLFRSRAFWFGVPGLVFLLWAWADSMATGTQLRAMWKNSSVSDAIMHHGGSVYFSHWPDSFGGSLVPKRWAFDRQKRGDARDWFPKFEAEEGVLLGGGMVLRARVVVPHWLLLLLYLPAWGALVGWRLLSFRRALLNTTNHDRGTAARGLRR